MNRLILFKTESHQSVGEFPGGGLSDILGQHHDYSGNFSLEAGYRLPEFKNDEGSASFNHQGGATHRRESAWRVVRVDEYVPNTGLEQFGEVAIAYCIYSPLPEDENPWMEMPPAQVSLDSFGGDVEAYDKWRATLAHH